MKYIDNDRSCLTCKLYQRDLRSDGDNLKANRNAIELRSAQTSQRTFRNFPSCPSSPIPMGKRNRRRGQAQKGSNAANGLQTTTQRSIFQQTNHTYSARDEEYVYEKEAMPDVTYTEEDYNEEEWEENEAEEEAVNGRQAFDIDGLVAENGYEDDEWDVQPQTEAIAYLRSVRDEAKGLPSMAYVSRPVIQPVKPVSSNGITKTLTRSAAQVAWESQFLKYYTTLRQQIAETPQPNFTQEELDELLHINPDRRPTTSSDEDGLWRIKTLDLPSLDLLSMLDHQRTIHLLTHLRKKMSANVNVNQCIWLVHLLARLGDLGVLTSEEVDLLRRIGKKCLAVRNGTIDKETENVVLSTIDMVVCIVKNFYEQKDIEQVSAETSNS